MSAPAKKVCMLIAFSMCSTLLFVGYANKWAPVAYWKAGQLLRSYNEKARDNQLRIGGDANRTDAWPSSLVSAGQIAQSWLQNSLKINEKQGEVNVTATNSEDRMLVTLSKTTYHKLAYEAGLRPADCGSEAFMGIIVVQSLPEHAAQREIIRETWASLALSLGYKVVFFMGTSQGMDFGIASAEAGKHNDILLVDFDESYLNLTLKSIIMIDWVSAHCRSARFLVKADDDVFLYLDTLHSLLSRRMDIKRQILGVQAENYSPIRSPDSKWYMPYAVYNKQFYPTFVYGPCYVLSVDLLGEISAMCKNKSYVPYEDVFTTGMCAEGLPGVTRYNSDVFVQTRCGVAESIAVHWYSCWQGKEVELRNLLESRRTANRSSTNGI